MTPRQLLDLLELPLSVAKPSPLLTLQTLHIADEQATGTDLVTTIRADLRKDGVLHGVTGCVDAKRLSLALNTLDPATQLQLSQEANTLTLRCGRAKRTLGLLPAQDFPMPANIEADTTAVADAAALAKAMRFAAVAMANGDIRPMLNGLTVDAGHIGATDGFRANLQRGAGSAAGLPDGAIVPRVALDKILRLANEAGSDSGQPLHIGVGRTRGDAGPQAIVARWGCWTVHAILIDARPVPFERVVPSQHAGIVFDIGRQTLGRSARNMAKLLVSDGGKVKPGIKLKLSDGALSIELVDGAGAGPGERMRDELDVAYAGADWTAAVNPAFLADALDALSGDMVRVSCEPKSMSGALYLTGSEPQQHCVVMPMRN